MPTNNKYRAYKNYWDRIARKSTLFQCFFCAALLLAKHFQTHLLTEHSDQYSNKHSCAWCKGEYFWQPKQKWTAVEHLDACFKSFLERHHPRNENDADELNPIIPQPPPPADVDADPPPAPAASPPPPFVVTLNHLLKTCLEKSFFNRQMHPSINETLLCDDTLFPLTPEMNWWHDVSNYPNRLSFWDANDDLGIQTIKQMEFIKKHHPRSTIQFFHLMVRASSFASFVQHMREYGSNAFLLPFSCLCDGGNTIPKNAAAARLHAPVDLSQVSREHLIHRHMLLIARDGTHFMENCWKKVGKVPNSTPKGRGKGKKKKNNTAVADTLNKNDENPLTRHGGPSDDESDDAEDENERRLYTRKYVRINHWFHLKNAIVYVSNVRSTCSFHSAKKEYIQKFPYVEEIEEEEEGVEGAAYQTNRNNPRNRSNPSNNNNNNRDRNHHFYIMRSITKYFGWMAALSVVGGIHRELTQIFGQRRVETYFRHLSRIYDTVSHCWKYGIQLQHLVPEDMLNQVMPVSKEFYAVGTSYTARGSTYYFHLPRKQHLLFAKYTDENSLEMESSEWYRTQAAAGLNLFFNVIRDEYWFPPKHQQRTIAFGFTMKAYYEEQMRNRIAEEVQRATEDQNEQFSERYERVTRERDEIRDYINEVQEEFQRDVANMKNEMERRTQSFQNEMTAIRQEMIQRENLIQNAKNEEIYAMQDENKTLRAEMVQKANEHLLLMQIKNEEMAALREGMTRKENEIQYINQLVKSKENQIQFKNEEIRQKEREHERHIQTKNEEIIKMHKMLVETLQKQIGEYKIEINKLIHLAEESHYRNRMFLDTIKKLQELLQQESPIKRKRPKSNVDLG